MAAQQAYDIIIESIDFQKTMARLGDLRDAKFAGLRAETKQALTSLEDQEQQEQVSVILRYLNPQSFDFEKGIGMPKNMAGFIDVFILYAWEYTPEPERESLREVIKAELSLGAKCTGNSILRQAVIKAGLEADFPYED